MVSFKLASILQSAAKMENVMTREMDILFATSENHVEKSLSYSYTVTDKISGVCIWKVGL